MNWLQEYKDLIQKLAQIQTKNFAMDLENIEELADEFEQVFPPLQDGTVDPGDLEAITNAYWDRYASRETEGAKKEIAIHRHLALVYEQLSHAPEEEWSLFAQLHVEARFAAQRPLWQFLAEISKD